MNEPKAKPAEQSRNDNGGSRCVQRLVRRIFPAPWWALMIFGSCILCIIQGNYLAACWAFTAGSWCQASYEVDSPNNQAERQP